MSRIRIDDSAEYWWSLPCSLLRDSRLSYEARGVACHLLSLGRNWQLRAVALPRVLHDQSRAKGHLGRDLCRRILRELEDAGYLARRKFQDEEGLWRWESVLTPVSQKVSQTSMACLAGDGETVDGTSVAGEGGDICVGEYKEEVVVKNIKPLLQTGAVGNSPKTGEASAPLDLSHPSLLPYLRVISDVTRRFGPSLTAEQIQLVADELAGVLSAAGSGKHAGIRSVRSWLLAVMNSAVAGEFIAEFAPNIARWRKNRQEAMEAAQSRAPVQQSEAEVNEMIDANEMVALIESCRREMQAMLPADEFASLSSKTRQDYRQLGRTLLQRARYAEGGAAEVMTATLRPTTFYKRVAALRYCLYADLVEQLKSLRSALSARPVDELQVMAIQAQLQQQRAFLREFDIARQSGHPGERRKRASKRQALRGLPGEWREQLYQRAAKGKYADAILVAALTGCRPEELRRGVLIRRVDNPRSGMGEIRFEIDGAKVKAHQGQPHRLIAYGAHDPHPLLEALRIRLAGRRELLVCIDSPVNFTVEVRRLARSLWPKHKHTVTAYCLRHQWAADLKRHAAADSVSQGLGHASAKTRRHYGQANQASSRHALHPIAIEAERSVRPATAKAPRHRAASSKTVTP